MVFKAGDKVTALIYSKGRRWMKGLVVGMTSEKEMREGYRFGVLVEIEDGSVHWVCPSDCMKRRKEAG